jgi:di/tricarboxylate transporter
MAIYFLAETEKRREKWAFGIYLLIASLWAFDRFLLKIRKISDLVGITTMGFMILATTILFLYYLYGLWQLGKIQWELPKQLRQYWEMTKIT